MLGYLRNRSWDLGSTDGVCQYSSSPYHSCFIVLSAVCLENYNSSSSYCGVPQCRAVFYGYFAFHFNLNLVLLCPVIFISLRQMHFSGRERFESLHSRFQLCCEMLRSSLSQQSFIFLHMVSCRWTKSAICLGALQEQRWMHLQCIQWFL